MLLSTKTACILVDLVSCGKFICWRRAQFLRLETHKLSHRLFVSPFVAHFLSQHFTDHPRDARAPLGCLDSGPVRNPFIQYDSHVFHVHDIGVTRFSCQGLRTPATDFTDCHRCEALRMPHRTPSSEPRGTPSERRTANGEQRTANSERRTANGEQRTVRRIIARRPPWSRR
jgi:hypothetical protein